MSNTLPPDYAVAVNGQPVSVYSARVPAHPLNQVWPGYQRPLEQAELGAFASWDLNAPVEVHVTAPGLPPSSLMGFDAEHLVQLVTIENLRLNGQIVTTLAAAGITVNEFVREVKIWARSPRILFRGNSITLHGTKADIGWTGNWGMAASAQDKDYVHRLSRRFAAAAGGAVPAVRFGNIAEFEREHHTFAVTAQFKAHADFIADTVVLAIGENVPALATAEDSVAFHTAMAKLLALLKQNHAGALRAKQLLAGPGQGHDSPTGVSGSRRDLYRHQAARGPRAELRSIRARVFARRRCRPSERCRHGGDCRGDLERHFQEPSYERNKTGIRS